jgi:twinkle protein
MDIRNYMHSKGWNWKEENRPKGLTAILNCPFCGDTEKKFAVSLVDGAFNCLHKNNCGRTGSFWDLQKMLGDKPVKLDNNNFVTQLKPIKYDRPKIHSDSKIDPAVEYLKSRGLTEETIKKFRIGFKNGAVMFPYFKNGELLQVKYRSVSEKKFWKEKNCETSLYNHDNCTGEALAIAEGEIDCMTLDQYGIPATSIPSGVNDLTWIENEWDYINKFKKIYLFMDSDSAGQNAVYEIVNRLGAWRCYSVVLPYKDANACLTAGISTDIILQAISDAKEFDPPTLLKASDFKDEINELFEHPEKLYGVQTPWDGLNRILKGWRDGEITIWSGRNGSGKSTLLNEVIIHLLKHKHKTIIASLEMPAKRYLRWMIMSICQLFKPERNKVESTLNWLGENLYVVNVAGSISAIELLNVLEFSARKYGVKNFIVDSLIKIMLKGVDDLKEQKEIVTDLINLAVKYSGHVHLVAHPRKGFKDNDKPDKVDVAGSGDITNLAHNVLVVWRPDEEEKERHPEISDTILFVKKNREFGTEGHVNFLFNSETKNFTEL